MGMTYFGRPRVSVSCYILYLFLTATITNYQKLSGLNQVYPLPVLEV